MITNDVCVCALRKLQWPVGTTVTEEEMQTKKTHTPPHTHTESLKSLCIYH